MSSGPWDLEIPRHFPIDINAEGQGPETDPDKVVRTVCWDCMPEEEWPCEGSREEQA